MKRWYLYSILRNGQVPGKEGSTGQFQRKGGRSAAEGEESVGATNLQLMKVHVKENDVVRKRIDVVSRRAVDVNKNCRRNMLHEEKKPNLT